MIEFSYLPNDDTEEKDLDAYARAHPLGSAYHLSAWRRSVELAYGYPGQALVARDGRDGRIVGLLPLCKVTLPLGRPRWISLPFCDLGGPLADSGDIAAALTAKARELLETQAAHLELRCSAPGPSDEAALDGKKVRMLLELPASAEELMAAYSPKLRSQIRKAEKNGLAVEVTAGAAAVQQFYEVYSRNMRRLGSPPHSRRWFDAIERCYGAGGDVAIALVRHQDVTVGAGLVLLCGKNAVIPWASTLAEYNPLAPNMLLYWAIQQHLCERGVQQFDFGRSTFGEGTYKFKKQWGARAVALDWQRWSKDGRDNEPAAPGGPGARLRPMIERAWKNMPLSITNQLGPRLRRYITL